MFHIIDVPTRRTKRNVPLYMCMECGSMSNASDYVESDEQLERDLQWNISVEERNKVATKQLFATLRTAGLDPKSVLEIGCGTGLLLSEAAKSGIRTLGFDINRHAVTYGRSTYGCDIRNEYWNAETVKDPYELVLSISVLEHISEPRGLLSEISKYCTTYGSSAFISVPFVDKEKWHFLLDTNPSNPGTPFFDNDVHVTHFSSNGMEQCLHEFGAKKTSFLKAGLWHGFLCNF